MMQSLSASAPTGLAADLGTLGVRGKEAVGAQSHLLVCLVSFDLVVFVPINI